MCRNALSQVSRFLSNSIVVFYVKNRHGLVGLWGDFCEREGFGKYVEWVQKDSGTLKKEVVPVRDTETGKMKVPVPEVIVEYIMMMATGDTKARPKGGTEEYGCAWHHSLQQAHFQLKPRTHGRGPYANTPFLFVSIEKNKEALASFYDVHLQVRSAACFARMCQCIAHGVHDSQVLSIVALSPRAVG